MKRKLERYALMERLYRIKEEALLKNLRGARDRDKEQSEQLTMLDEMIHEYEQISHPLPGQSKQPQAVMMQRRFLDSVRGARTHQLQALKTTEKTTHEILAQVIRSRSKTDSMRLLKERTESQINAHVERREQSENDDMNARRNIPTRTDY